MNKLFLMTVLLSGSIVFAADSGTSSPIKQSASGDSFSKYTVQNLIENASKDHETVCDAQGKRYNSFEDLCAICPVNRKYKGTTALHEAVKAGILKNVETLLYWSANSNVTNDNKETPLHLAALARRQDIVAVLIRTGASREYSQDHLRFPQEPVNPLRNSDK